MFAHPGVKAVDQPHLYRTGNGGLVVADRAVARTARQRLRIALGGGVFAAVESLALGVDLGLAAARLAQIFTTD